MIGWMLCTGINIRKQNPIGLVKQTCGRKLFLYDSISGAIDIEIKCSRCACINEIYIRINEGDKDAE